MRSVLAVAVAVVLASHLPQTPQPVLYLKFGTDTKGGCSTGR